ncbi:AAA family ATPase [Bifidobacterium biavatii]|uniref:Nuclease SbcCD subunit C n=1 Tax=Bifidobacterium biavatii DSM 23969 TaxID=1437608 RepID=A0A087A0B2_9BIFI|nr:SMC family ATPase [Bifidobacterium biavatii]KFI52212.1 exonuclease SbcC [Bifidobacterium biavatii DSM 23969]
MKLIAMKFQGVGPYKGEFAIDFAALTSSHMFLIDGETGAGKTTILDCLTFALYGATSNGEDGESKQRFRSRFLMNDRTETYVDLMFKSGDEYYEVRRYPAYEQPKANGTGFTNHASKVSLMRIDPGIADLAKTAVNDPQRYFDYVEEANHRTEITTREKEAGEEITRIIGLDRRQFGRTIMLAQGQFSAFLRMNPEDRTNLVKDLLGAEVYQQIQDELKDRCNAMRKDVANSDTALVSSITHARSVARQIGSINQPAGNTSSDESSDNNGINDTNDSIDATDNAGASDHADGTHDTNKTVPLISDNAPWGLTDTGTISIPLRSPEQIRAIISRTTGMVSTMLTQRITDGKRAVEEAEHAAEHARLLSQTAESLRERADQEASDLHALLNLNSQHDGVEADRRSLDRSDEAKPIVAQQRERTKQLDELEQHKRQLSVTTDELHVYPARQSMADEREQAVKAAAGAEAARKDLEQADAHERLIAEAEQSRQRHAQALNMLAKAQAEVQDQQTALEHMPSPESLDEEIQNTDQRLGGAQGLRDQLAHGEELLQHARRAEQLTVLIPAQQRQLDEAQQAEHDAERTVHLVEQSIRDSGAAQYAEGLVEGEACPVCGSEHHPKLAVRPDGEHSSRELESLKERLEHARKHTQDAYLQLQQSNGTLESERQQAESLSTEEAQQRIDELQQRIAELDEVRKKREELTRIKKAVSAAIEAVAAAEKQQTGAETDERATRERMEADRRRAEGYTTASVQQDRELARHRLAEAEAQGKHAEQLQRRINEYDALDKRRIEQQTQVDALTHALSETERILADLVRDSRFDSVEDAWQACLTDEVAAELRERVDRYQDRMTTARANLNRSRATLHVLVSGLGGDMRSALQLPDPSSTIDETSQATRTTRTHDANVAEHDANDSDLDAPAVGPVSVRDDGTFTALGNAIAALDVETFRIAQQQAGDRLNMANTEYGSIRTLGDSWERALHDLDNHADSWQKLRERFEPLQSMSALSNAETNSVSMAKRKMSLITYAVTARFRDVLDRANELLADIQGGIYELRLDDHADASAGRNKKLGLAITVFDRRTEQERNPVTLSGGETFFVSLALALALADIIQAENGGVAMDTLFVDEGFGSLSSEYLNDVVDMLHRISRNRDIGIISHVDWLKDQIAERIAVSRVTPDGASRLDVIA